MNLYRNNKLGGDERPRRLCLSGEAEISHCRPFTCINVFAGWNDKERKQFK